MTNVTTMEGMFNGCTLFNKAINFTTSNLLSNITNMLAGCYNFNGGNASGVLGTGFVITDTSGITSFASLFAGNTNFNQAVTLKTSGLLNNLSNMFNGCIAFNNIIKISIMSNVTTMEGMFYGCTLFNKAINFTTSNLLTNITGMLYNCQTFNGGNGSGSVGNGFVISDTTGITSFSYLFAANTVFNQQISLTGGTGLVDVSYMFAGCTKFNNTITTINTNNVTTMEGMFRDSIIFNKAINFTTSNLLTNITGMLYNCQTFNGGNGSGSVGNGFVISDTTGITSFSYLFAANTVFNQQISLTGGTGLVDVSYMFAGCTKFNNTITTINTNNVTNMEGMFINCFIFNKPITFDTSSVTNMKSMFQNCQKFNDPSISNLVTNNVTTMESMFQGCITFNQVASITNATTVWPQNIVPAKWYTNNVTTMKSMFEGCSSFTNGNDEGSGRGYSYFTLFIPSVTTMSKMFKDCERFTQKIYLYGNSDGTNVLTDVSFMLYNCKFYNKLLSLNVINVTNFYGMFYNCSGYITRDSSNWGTMLSAPKNSIGQISWNNDVVKPMPPS